MTFKEAYKYWIVMKEKQVKASTLMTYKNIYITHLDSMFGDKDVESLNKKTVVPILYDTMEKDKISKKYCCDMLIVFNMIMRYVGDEYDVDIPDTHWKMVWPTNNRQGAKKIERYSPAESKKIVDYIMANPSPRNLAILMVLCTGMRIGEICALQWKDIDLDSKTIHVCKTMGRISDHELKKSWIEIGPPKTVSSDRYIPILKNIFPLVKKFAAVCKPEYYVCTCSESFSEPRTFRMYYNKFIIEKVKLENCIKFHSARHIELSLSLKLNGLQRFIS